jgi:hypothetical protein
MVRPGIAPLSAQPAPERASATRCSKSGAR